MRDRIFYSICFGFVFGVLLRSFLSVNFYFVVFTGVLSFVLILFTYFTKLKWGVIISVFILTFSLGVLRFHVADHSAASVFDVMLGQKVSFSGEIVDEPDIRENNQKLTILLAPQGLAFKDSKARPFPATRILATVNFGQDFKYGDEVDVSGKLEKPENFITDQGKSFDYINYLRKDEIFYVMNYPTVEIISRNNGTIHIVTLSGYNVTIVAEWFMKLFTFLPQNLGIGMGILAILLFVLMTGGSSTAVRAGIMATLALIARATGRNYDVARALILAGVVMILINPFVLVFDVSFQLSFIATV